MLGKNRHAMFGSACRASASQPLLRPVFASGRGALTVACLLWAICSTCFGQTTKVEVELEAIDAVSKEITARYNTGFGEKEITLDVSRKADISLNGERVSLEELLDGIKATIEYNKDLEIVTSISAVGMPSDGWKFIDLEGTGNVEPDNTIIFGKDGVLISREGIPGWYLLSSRRFEEMVFSIEYKYFSKQLTGGALVFATPGPSEGGKGMPFGIEVKLGKGVCGNIDLPSEEFKADLPLGQIRNARRVPRAKSVDPIIDEWNRLQVTCSADGGFTVKLNGETINQLANAQNTSGKVALWPMRAEIHFRNASVLVDGGELPLDFEIK